VRANGDDGQQFKKKLMNDTIQKHEESTGSVRPSSVQKFCNLKVGSYFTWNEKDEILKFKSKSHSYRYAATGETFDILVPEANVIQFA
jgi:hypothetical protein